MAKQTKARLFQPSPCADPGCGKLARPGGIFCAGRRLAELVPQDDEDLDVHVLTLRERLAGDGPWLRRIRRYGTHPCALCGREALPGRRYCSPGCRGVARNQGAAEVELDGVRAPLLEHARRRGLSPGTVYGRLGSGLTPEEALTRPVNEEMRDRRMSAN